MAPTAAAAWLQADDISDLLEEPQDADFALVCEGETVMAYSYILAARLEECWNMNEKTIMKNAVLRSPCFQGGHSQVIQGEWGAEDGCEGLQPGDAGRPGHG
jgi:hypothetical protein